MMPYIPNALIEAANGVVSILMLWMFVFGVLHLRTMYHEHRTQFRGRGGVWRTFGALYRYNKPEIALITFIGGMCLRQSMFWYFRVLQDHDWHATNFITKHGAQITIFTTMIMIIGATCWIRVISPFPRGLAALTWLMMAGTAIAIGVGLAMIG